MINRNSPRSFRLLADCLENRKNLVLRFVGRLHMSPATKRLKKSVECGVAVAHHDMRDSLTVQFDVQQVSLNFIFQDSDFVPRC